MTSVGMRSVVLTGGLLVAMAGVDAAGDVVLQPKTGQPVLGLTAEQLERFELGKIQFDRVWEPEEGLGPVFNNDGCGACHNTPNSGGSGTVAVTRFGKATKGGFDPLEEFGGSLLQMESISPECAEFVSEKANVEINRITNPAFGLGLVEAIADEDILALESDPPGVSGRAHMVEAFEDPGVPRVGRMGWKAQVPTVLTFSADAALNEIGITNFFVGTENAPNGDEVLLAECDDVPDPEDTPDGEGFEFIDRITDFQRFLTAPPQTPRSGMTGEVVFTDIGCADCHTPSFVTGVAPEDALSGVTIKPYSDFLLHDMGLLGDGIVQGDASELEIRTPNLWGLSFRDPILHDGRFAGDTFENRVTGAILEHSQFGTGEAADSVAAFEVLLADDIAHLMAFLESLGRAEFDHDGDNDVDNLDKIDFDACFSGPGSFYTPDDECAISDVDQDGDVDCDDWQYFREAFDGAAYCDGDVNGDGNVDPLDAGAVLARFGQDPNVPGVGCEFDANGDGTIDPLDNGYVLARFGPCAE